ncbi:MAG: fructosamine kinase family protein [Aquisalimonadaceae bacterium]
MWDVIAQAVADALGEPFTARERAPVAGGDINDAWRLGDGQRDVFVKTNKAALLGMFEAETEGLSALAAAGGLRVPRPVACGTAGDKAWLALEWVTLQGRGDWAALGAGLATVHRSTATEHGWHRDNTIGSTRQPNARNPEWPAFFAEQRLGYQLDLAEHRGAAGHGLLEAGRRLQQDLPALFGSHQPVPSLLHGDLWSGNVAFDAGRAPVIYDPAVYYGDRESDLAMTELFGHFPDAFYAAYQEAWPLDTGYAVRRTLYQLYHVLNHGNLFGGGYWGQAEGMIGRLIAEMR